MPDLRAVQAAVVLRPREHACDVLVGAERVTAAYAKPFGSRAASLTPGHLVAVTVAAQPSRLVLWRWYDAVVLEQSAGQVRLWEPAHGEVLATPRRSGRRYAPGTRAYASAGLPGADWWVAGPVGPLEDADVELDEVCRFYEDHGLWSGLV